MCSMTRKWYFSVSITSYSCTMFGCRTRRRISISRRTRMRSSSDVIFSFSSTLTAIFSSVCTCMASFTLPKEPSPRFRRITYVLLFALGNDIGSSGLNYYELITFSSIAPTAPLAWPSTAVCCAPLAPRIAMTFSSLRSPEITRKNSRASSVMSGEKVKAVT